MFFPLRFCTLTLFLSWLGTKKNLASLLEMQSYGTSPEVSCFFLKLTCLKVR